ncbi:MAG: discoidin domain-containing protein [Calditrichaceae bacterium]
MDLGKECTINAVQINYAENETQIFGRKSEIYYQYLLEHSNDGKSWSILADKTNNKTDIPHDYIEIINPVKARFVRLTNYHMPSGTFALAGLRVFGNGGGEAPSAVNGFKIDRLETDRCIANLNWEKSPDATGVNIYFGNNKDKLYHNYQVIGADSVTIRSLNSLLKYYFSIEAFNENGISERSESIGVD